MIKQVNVHGQKWNVFDHGTGEPLLFVHGFPLDHSMWIEQLSRFSTTHRVIAPDLPGFGKSEPAEDVMTMERFADGLSALLDELQVEQPVTFCGLSMGGYIAWQFWKHHKNRLSRLILCDTKAAGDSEEVQLTRYQNADRVLREGPDFLVSEMIQKLFSKSTQEGQPQVVSAVQTVMRQTSPSGIAAALKGMAQRLDVTDWLPQIDLPVLLIVGEEDQLTPPAVMHEVGAALPQSSFVVVSAAGHLAPLENPAATNQAIETFLNGTGSPTA